MAFGFDNIAGAGDLLYAWVINPLIWLVVIGVVILVIGGFLYIRRRRKLIYPTIEIVDLGNGKFNFNKFKSGYFGKKKALFGLWNYGEEVLKTKYGETIHYFSTEDYQEVDGKRGIVCYKDPLNKDILVPISHLKTNNKNLIADIAPASYRDTSIEIINETIRETKDWTEKLYQFLGWALVVIFSLVSIIVIAQMVKHGQTEAAGLIIDAGKVCTDNCAEVCSKIASGIRSTTAP